MRANIVEQDRPQTTIWRIRIALSQYVILIAFQWKQWFREGASIRSYVHCLCFFFGGGRHLKLCTSSHARAETAR